MLKGFISWSDRDSRIGPIARHLRNWLEVIFDGQVEFFFSEEIQIGLDWQDEVNEALATSDFALFLLSERTARSPWVMFEFGYLQGSAEKGRLFPLLFDMTAAEMSNICPPLSHIQAKSILDSKSMQDLVGRICDISSNDARTRMATCGLAARTFGDVKDSIIGEIENNNVFPNKFSGLIPFNHNINQSDNFKMPEVFSKYKSRILLVGINLGFLLNLDDNVDRFRAMMLDLIKNKSKRVDILISDIWHDDKILRNAYLKVERGRVKGDLDAFDNVFTRPSHGRYIDRYVRQVCSESGGEYGDVCNRLTIKKIDLLMDTFWFIDPDIHGDMMLVPMTGSEGSSRPAFYVNAKENKQLFDYYYFLCKGAFDAMSSMLWPNAYASENEQSQ